MHIKPGAGGQAAQRGLSVLSGGWEGVNVGGVLQPGTADLPSPETTACFRQTSSLGPGVIQDSLYQSSQPWAVAGVGGNQFSQRESPASADRKSRSP